MPDTTRFPSRNQEKEICLGLKSVAWQMSLDVRWGLPEKASRGGTKMPTLGALGFSTSAEKDKASAAPGLTPPPAAGGARLTWERHLHGRVAIGVLDSAQQVLFGALGVA